MLLALAAPAGAAAPTDPLAGSQEPLRIMRVPEAIDRIASLQDVLVLTPDTGLDLDHPDLQSRLFSLPAAVAAPDPENQGPFTVQAGRPGWDLIGTLNPPNLQPDDDPSDPPQHGHGTAVAGVLGAAWDNGAGGAGVAPNARFIALRTCWNNDDCYQHVQASAFNWAADRGARVVSMSWLSGPLDPATGFEDAIAGHPGVLFVAIPSGNGGAVDADAENPMPCMLDYPNVLCVSTSASDDGLACGAYGATSVDVAVPTQNNVTTTNGGGFGAAGCATSYAAPAAAGVATILFGIDPTASPADVKAAIMDSARRVPAWAGKSVTGGIVDAEAAVALFQQRRGIAPRTPPPPGGTPAPDQPAPVPESPRDLVPPQLALDVAPDVFRAGGRGARLASPRGASVVATLSEPAELRVVFERARPGRRRGARCVQPVRAPRGRRCRRWVRAGVLTRALAAGTARIRISGLDARRRRLPVGSYRARGRARDAAGNTSLERTSRFRIAAR